MKVNQVLLVVVFCLGSLAPIIVILRFNTTHWTGLQDTMLNQYQETNVGFDDIASLYKLAELNTDVAESNYFLQREWERKYPLLFKFGSNFPCFWGESFIDSDIKPYSHEQTLGLLDGGKWACGVQYIQQPCIIYSIGSYENYKFEYGINNLSRLIQCEIFIFDPFHFPNIKHMQKLASNMHFYKWGVSNINNKSNNTYRLSTIMKLLSHTHIDILKIDIEGWEFEVFHSLDKYKEWPSIGQILIEIHYGSDYMTYTKYKNTFGANRTVRKKNEKLRTMDRQQFMLISLMQLFEKYNFRIFHKELNGWDKELKCVEIALIQKNWKPNTKQYNTKVNETSESNAMNSTLFRIKAKQIRTLNIKYENMK